MWPYMCLCCGLFVPTQFHFECCGVRDDMYFLSKYFLILRYVKVFEFVFVFVFAHVFHMYKYMYIFRDPESGLRKTKSVWT